MQGSLLGTVGDAGVWNAVPPASVKAAGQLAAPCHILGNHWPALILATRASHTTDDQEAAVDLRGLQVDNGNLGSSIFCSR